jgi:hypothetical protein
VETVEGLGDPFRGMLVIVLFNRGNLDGVVLLQGRRRRNREDGLKVVLGMDQYWRDASQGGRVLPVVSAERA